MFTKTVRTKHDAKATSSTETKVTVDFTGVPQAKIEELAASSVIITEQSVWREGTIPAICTIKVSEQLARPKGGGFKMTPEAVLRKAMSDPEFMKQALEALKSASKK